MYLLAEEILTTLKSSSHIPLTAREALSGVTGSISIASWIFLLIPQLVENYRNQSAEALSLNFILIWFLGDVTNLLGALWAGLVPTAVALAVYFCIQDVILLLQCLYYNIRNRRRLGKDWLASVRESVSGDANGAAAEAVARVHREQQHSLPQQRQDEEVDDDEEQPLLKRTMSASNATSNRGTTGTTATAQSNLSPVQRRESLNSEMRLRRRSSHAQNNNALAKILEEQDTASSARRWAVNFLCLLMVFAIGTAGWWLSYKSGTWKPQPPETGRGDDGEVEPIAKGAQILGYISALAYLGARMPQIIKNWREQSCEGLSLLFFMLSLSGNLMYGATLLFHSLEHRYIIKNVPWLIGSLGTIVEDMIICAQFQIYQTKNPVGESAVL